MAQPTDLPPFADAEQNPDENAGADTHDPEMDRFLDLSMRVSVELDRKRTRFEEILNLREGSVVRMERSAGENVDLLLQGIPIGNGEIVVIEDTVGLRVTDLNVKSSPRRRSS